MNNKPRIFLWVSAIVTLPLSIYFLISAVFYSWIGEVNPSQVSPDKADTYATVYFGLFFLSFAAFMLAVVFLIRRANRSIGSRNNGQA